MDEQAGGRVSDGKRDLLVIISGERAEESFKQIDASYKVQHVASHRVVVVEGSQSEMAKLKEISGVTVTASGDVPPGVVEQLDEGEALFVAAWSSRIKEGPSKQRAGEGLSWDAPGFEPPDLPADSSKHNK